MTDATTETGTPTSTPEDEAIESAKQRAIAAVQHEDPAAIIEAARTMRSALWRRDSAVRAERARQERDARKIANRQGV